MQKKLRTSNFASGNNPHLCFVASGIGNYSEVWMWRQLVGISRLNVDMLTWKYLNEDIYPLSGVRVRKLGFNPQPANAAGLSRWFYRFQCMPGRNFYATVGRERKEIEEWVTQVKPDVILAQYGSTGLRILPVAKKWNIPVVVHFHGLDLSSSLNNRWYRWSLLKKLHDFSAIVVVGSHQKQWMLDHGVPERKVHLIPCGVSVDEFIPKKYLDNNSDGVKFIAVGRLVESKGYEYTIRAFALVKMTVAMAKLKIIGDGPLRESLKGLVKELNIESAVDFCGNQSSEAVKQELREADIFIQHSHIDSIGSHEGFGVTLAEASSVSLPIVATKCGGIIDQVVDGKTGFLVEQKDVDAMAERMLQLAREAALRQKMGQEGRKRMINHFDTKGQIAKLEEVLLNCVKYD